MLGFKVLILAIHVLVSLICASHQYLSPAPAQEADLRKLMSVPSPESTSMIRASPGNKGKKPQVFDVTRYGAVPDGATETSSAFLAAWHDACAHPGNVTLLVPNGTFFIGPITFEGPCHNKHSPMVTIRGILKAPSRLSSFPTSTWIVFRKLCGLNLIGEIDTTTLDGQGAKAWALGSSDKKIKPLSRPISLKFAHVSNGTIRNIGLLNSKNFHMSFSHCKGIVVDGVKITAPWNSPNTDGIHISGSTNIRITSSTIGVGDDCVSIGPGTTNISIVNVTCGPGHGFSIGSLGKYPKERNVRGITVKNCTINGTQNGVRVKTWPGSPPSMAANLTFQDIVMINVSNPIVIDQEYCPNHTCLNYKPSHVKLRNIHFRNIKGTYRTKSAVTLVCSSRVACENIEIVNVKLNHTTEETPLALSFKVKGALNGLQILV